MTGEARGSSQRRRQEVTFRWWRDGGGALDHPGCEPDRAGGLRPRLREHRRARSDHLARRRGWCSARGYPIDQLAEQSSFLESAYLLSTAICPLPGLAEWEDSITRHTMLREDMKYLFEAF